MKRIFGLLTLLIFVAGGVFAQQGQSIKGEVADSQGASVVGATVVLVDSQGKDKTTTTDSNGKFTFTGVVPGDYTLAISATGFAPYNNAEFNVKPSGNETSKIALKPEEVSAEVDVNPAGQIDTDPANNAGALVLKEDDLKGLPDDPDELEAALQALAGGAAGPNGGQIYIDGFSGQGMPPKEAIREIRINRDMFSAEYPQPGFGRIEILTKPGAMKWSGQAFFNFNDSAFNARNPFSVNKASRTQMTYGGYISGPIVKDKASFSMSLNNRDATEGTAVNATVLDNTYNITPLQQEFKEPRKRFSIGPRLDYQINDSNTLVTRYEYSRGTSEDFGGNFTLPSRGTKTKSSTHELQITETAILNPTTVNETRFQFARNSRDQTGASTSPSINVSDAFNGGGSSVGLSYNKNTNIEFQNNTMTSFGKNAEHAVKFGVSVNYTKLEDRSDSNYNGTFTFTGGYVTTPGNIYDLDGNGVLSSIEQYRAKVLGAVGTIFNPSQFSITTGDPISGISQTNFAIYAKDDWRINPGLTLSYGLRYENQTNIDDNFDFAPRLSVAWSPGAGGASPPKTVFRGGVGIFFTRFSENLSLTAERLNGVSQQRYILNNSNPLLSQPTFSLTGVTNVPSISQLSTLSPLSNTPVVIAGDAKAPYNFQGAFGVERQVLGNGSLAAYYIYTKYLHLVRQRNINAPVCPIQLTCPTNDPASLQALRPDPTKGNIYQYETSGFGVDNRLMVRFSKIIAQKYMAMVGYSLGFSKANTDGAGGGGLMGRGGFGQTSGGFPAYSYDLDGEYAYSSNDSRHSVFFMTSYQAPWGIAIRPMGFFNTGTPYNFVVGRDLNGDSVFMERPSYQALKDACVANGLSYKWCDITGFTPTDIVPKNFARGTSSFTMNLSVDKNFAFGGEKGGAQGGGSAGGPGGGHGGGGGGRGGMMGGMMGGGPGGGGRGKYNLSVGMQIRNLFNTNNLGNPNSNISSSTFGDVLNGAGGFGGGARMIEFRTRFSW